MFEFCEKAIDILSGSGAEFGDIRVIETRRQDLCVRNGEISAADDTLTLGFGVRVLKDGGWGFASSSELSLKEIERVTKLAVEIASASSRLKKDGARLSPEPAYVDRWQSPFIIDPFAVSVEEKLKTLFLADSLMRKNKKIKSASGSLSCRRKRQFHATTEGSRIEQTFVTVGGGIEASASGGGEAQTRSYPSIHGGCSLQMGYEAIEAFRLAENAERVREEAVALLTAPECPSEEMDLIIGGDQLALQIHESVGHATELDRVLGYEESYAGSSFTTTEKYKNFRYGSPLVNLVADATLAGGTATAAYDDDGVKAQRWHIVKNGILSGYMTNREFCHVIGDDRSKGCNRADGFGSIPITRIANLSLMPGIWDYDELIADTKNGIIMDNNRAWSIDQKRLNFQFGCEMGWLVKNGKKTRLVRNPGYQGITPQFWNSCDAICSDKYWRLYGVVNCGKGQPTQIVGMCHGSSPARFRKVKIR